MRERNEEPPAPPAISRAASSTCTAFSLVQNAWGVEAGSTSQGKFYASGGQIRHLVEIISAKAEEDEG